VIAARVRDPGHRYFGANMSAPNLDALIAGSIDPAIYEREPVAKQS